VLDLPFVRAQFPALSEHWPDWALLDNAGGSVMARQVQARIADYMGRYMVQLGASYALSQDATAIVREAHAAAELLIGAQPGEVAIGPSTTSHAKTLAAALRPRWREGDAVVISELDHEANIGPWAALSASGIEVRTWRLRPETADLELDDLDALLDERVRLVCVTHCANVVGRIHDIPAIAERVHAAGAELCVDGVAYAPHRLVDVAALGADYYLLSLYKVYGPHLALLWGRRALLERAAGQNHFFIGEHELPYKLEPGNANHELCAGIPGILAYLQAVDAHHSGADTAATAAPSRASLARSFALFGAHEAALAGRLLEFLRSKPGVRVLGPQTGDPDQRVATIAFCVAGRKASEIPPRLDPAKLAIRWGHFYAVRAIEALGLAEADGVVRVSMVHYNTMAEVERLIAALDQLL
jgi:cysteine desulfurase family protein (TIGR01976 family)